MAQMASAEHHDMIEAFPVDRADQPFGIAFLHTGAVAVRSSSRMSAKAKGQQNASTRGRRAIRPSRSSRCLCGNSRGKLTSTPKSGDRPTGEPILFKTN